MIASSILAAPSWVLGKWHKVQWAAIGLALFARATRRGRVLATGPVVVELDGQLTLGRSVLFVSGMIPPVVRVHRGASMSVGDRSIFNYGSHFVAHHSISIGQRSVFASSVRVCDVDGARHGPIVIGDRVWVAHGATILPGVTIGDDAVISAGSVVGKDVPARHLAVGNPARVMPLREG